MTGDRVCVPENRRSTTVGAHPTRSASHSSEAIRRQGVEMAQETKHGIVKVPIQVQLTSGTYRVALYSGGALPSDTQKALVGTDVTVTVP
jgi:hypothetical protein